MAASTAASVSLRSRPLNLHRSLATPTIKSQSVVSFSGVGSKQRFARLRVSCAAKPETVEKVCKIVKKQLALPEDSKVVGESTFGDLGADSLDTAKPETVEKVCKIVKKQLALPEDSKVVGESKFGDIGADSLDTPKKLCSCNCFDVYKELVPYGKAWAWQKSIVDERKASIKRNEDCPETLIVLQHHPVYTMGTGSSEEFLNFDIKDSPFEVYRTERGGEVTFHGPGQLVLYPIINLRNHKMDLHWYLRTLEEVVIRALDKSFSIKASRIEGLTGVWVGNQKVAAMGIKVTQWIAYHGLALNVSTDLTWFNRIVPCGIRGRQVGSVKGILSESWPSTNHRCTNLHDLDDSRLINTARQSLITEFSEIFQLKIHHKPVSELEI